MRLAEKVLFTSCARSITMKTKQNLTILCKCYWVAYKYTTNERGKVNKS